MPEMPPSCIGLGKRWGFSRYKTVIFPSTHIFYIMPEGVKDTISRSVGGIIDVIAQEEWKPTDFDGEKGWITGK